MRFSNKDRREKPGRGDGRQNSNPSAMNLSYGTDIALLNIFENQIIPIRIHLHLHLYLHSFDFSIELFSNMIRL